MSVDLLNGHHNPTCEFDLFRFSISQLFASGCFNLQKLSLQLNSRIYIDL